MDNNRRFAELCGICWHEWIQYDHPTEEGWVIYRCSKCGEEPLTKIFPDFAADPRLVMQTLDEKGLLENFIIWLTNKLHDETGNSCIALAKLFKDKTGLLRDRAIEFMKRK